MSKRSNLINQCKRSLSKQCCYGQSKHEAKINEKEAAKREGRPVQPVRGIFSTSTYNSYSKVSKQFIEYVLEEHRSEVKKLEDCRAFVSEYLEVQQEKGNSAWTLHLYGSALGSVFNCSKNDFGFTYPQRSRENIKRCRGINSSDYRYPEEKWNNALTMCKACGTRRNELLRLRKEDFKECSDGTLQVYKRGKGGIERWCLVNPKYTDFVKEFIRTAETHSIDGENRLFLKAEIPAGSIHDLRADYAKDLYQYFDERGDIANGKLYHCRGDMAGKHFDKGILFAVSYNLQHTRTNVVVSSYLWKMK